MRIIVFVSALGILVSIAVLISVIIRSNKGAGKAPSQDGNPPAGK